MIQRCGIIGVGDMGGPIARHLLKKGFRLTVYARKERARREMKALGAQIAESPAELARSSQIIFLVVTDAKAVRELLFGPKGIVRGAAERTIIVDMTTSDPRTTREFSKRLDKRGIEYLDAPISGGALGARKGELLVMVGGERGTYAKCIPVFKAFSKRRIYLGKSGMGHLTKLVGNQLSISTYLLTCEAVLLGKKLGLAMDELIEVFNHGNARNYSTEVRFPKFVLPKNYKMGSTFAILYKDMSFVKRLEKRARMRLPMTDLAYEYIKHIMDQGRKKEDISKLILRMNGMLR